MSVGLQPWQDEQKRRDQEKAARIREAQLRGAETRRRRTRFKAFRTFLLLARTDERQISVALISKKSGISQAAFYENFKQDSKDGEDAAVGSQQQQHGIAILLEAVCDQIARVAIREMRSKIRKSETQEGHDAIGQLRRVAITMNTLIRVLFRYPNLFNVEGKIPRNVILALSKALAEAITHSEDMSDEERAEAEIMARYHTTALVGILRSGLGSHLEHAEFMRRLILRSVSQIIPVLVQANSKAVEQQLSDVVTMEPPALLGLTESPSYQNVLRMQMAILAP